VARGTYFVGLQGDQVVIYKGRPGGVWFIQPTVEKRTGLTLDGVPVSKQDAVRAGAEATSLAAAETYVDNLRKLRADELDIAAATGSATSTTIPVDPGATGSTSTSVAGRT
jgi:hypothetical protein